MSADQFHKFVSGEQINSLSARQLNSWTEAARRSSQHEQRPRPKANRFPRDSGRCYLWNKSGTTLKPFSVLQLDDSLYDGTDYVDEYLTFPGFKGVQVDEDDTELFGISRIPLQDGDIDQQAIFSGMAQVRLTGDADKKYATTKSGQYTLEAADSGPCRILNDPGPGGQERVAMVRIGGGCECKEIHRFWTNGPTAGTCKATYVINSVSEVISWAYNATSATVQTAFEGHSEIGAGNVEVTGGPFPFVSLYVKFKADLAGESIDFPAIDNTSLTSGKMFMDKFEAVELFP